MNENANERLSFHFVFRQNETIRGLFDIKSLYKKSFCVRMFTTDIGVGFAGSLENFPIAVDTFFRRLHICH